MSAPKLCPYPCLWTRTLPICLTLIVFSLFEVTDFGGSGGCGGSGKRIDIHHHFSAPFLGEYLAKYRSGDGGFNYSSFDVNASLRMMDRYSIERSILSISSPGVVVQNVDQQTIRQMARAINEYGAEIVRNHTGRFGLFATLTLPDVDGAVAEATYAVDVLHADGFIIDANQIVAGDSNDPLYELFNDRACVVLIHPSPLPGSQDLPSPIDGFDTYKVMADFLLSTVRALNIMLMTKVPQRFPNIRWITAHGGGFWPYASDRMAYRIGPYVGVRPEKLTQFVSSFFYFETASLAGPVSIRALTEFAQPGHLLFGSDWPLSGDELLSKCISSWDSYPFSSKTLHSINFGTAKSLLSNETHFPRQFVGSSDSSQGFLHHPKGRLHERYEVDIE